MGVQTKEFLAQQGRLGPGVRNGRGGRFTSSRSEKGRKFAQKVLFGKPSAKDPEYLTNLRSRINSGFASAQEIHLLRLLFGDPPKADAGRDNDQERFSQIRANILRFLQESPEEARVLNAKVTRAPRMLALPVRGDDPDGRA